jgi:hypothetical protein
MSRDSCYVTVIVGVAAHVEGLVLCYCHCRSSCSCRGTCVLLLSLSE